MFSVPSNLSAPKKDVGGVQSNTTEREKKDAFGGAKFGTTERDSSLKFEKTEKSLKTVVANLPQLKNLLPG